MADRAHHLARTLLARLRNLQSALAEEGRAALDRTDRIATIEKVLAVELGLTDGATLGIIEAALPDLKAVEQAPDRETAALADFLRRRLGRELADNG